MINIEIKGEKPKKKKRLVTTLAFKDRIHANPIFENFVIKNIITILL